jgi:putative membrane protein
MKGWLGIYLRGVAMGTADLVPGVSGGTIALITGIYARLLAALSQANGETVMLLARGHFARCWERIDGSFLLVLAAGMGTAILGFAEGIQFLLAHYPLVLWSFFFGLVLASAVMLLVTELSAGDTLGYFLVVLGASAAALIGLLPQGSIASLPGAFFLAGMLAITAMLLPGISGSFILLLLGMYAPVISAVTERDLTLLAVFAAGCAVGLLTFSRVLHWLMQSFRKSLMATLAGFLAGSLVILWPWQLVQSVIIDRHGEARSASSLPISPARFAAELGDPQLLLCGIGALVGIVVVTGLALARARV